ncbi:restriction endonuclease subunit S [Streptomyces sp. 4R-3d]|uniref:restriction endonuclease subunit S n=1 Tax=Streptomyces sp. 4R-3d TaxID=2559605 RepID=UPI00107273F1|nr:restriction endonuclease subunit S [Streptomyces sp. 4R-3d]TFI23481.1 restriction endonuclease subunit S [Streptomyces sp. 4R-3d]
MSVDWPVRCLTDVVSLPVGQVSPLDEPYRGQILLAPDHISAGTGEILKRETAESQGAVSGKYVVRPGDVVFSKIRPALRKVVLADFEGICSADTYPLKPGADVLGEFVKAVLLGKSFSRYVESLSGRTGIPKVNRADLAGFSFPVPPLPEQQRIVDVLQSVAKLERGIEASIVKLRSVREGLLLSLTGGRSDSPMTPLRELLDRLEVGVPSMGPEGVPNPGEWGVMRLGAVTSGNFDAQKIKRILSQVRVRPELEISRGDVLMVRVNGSARLVGSVCVVDEVPRRIMLSDLVMRLVADVRVLDPAYLGAVLVAPHVRRQIVSKFRGTSGQFQLPQEELRSVEIPLPSVVRQRKDVDVIATCDRKITREADELAKLRQLKAGLVDDLLSGRVAV